jgi:hypothetical protein
LEALSGNVLGQLRAAAVRARLQRPLRGPCAMPCHATPCGPRGLACAAHSRLINRAEWRWRSVLVRACLRCAAALVPACGCMRMLHAARRLLSVARRPLHDVRCSSRCRVCTSRSPLGFSTPYGAPPLATPRTCCNRGYSACVPPRQQLAPLGPVACSSSRGVQKRYPSCPRAALTAQHAP